MRPHNVLNADNPDNDLSLLLEYIHKNGPKDPLILETLAFYKEFHPNIFLLYEEKILSALGLFYKLDSVENLYSFLMQQFGEDYKNTYGAVLTPIQASIRRAVESHQYTSFSAPTSAGKSYSIRDFISDGVGDAVIVVPSRALIAEYVDTMRRKFQNDKSVMISSFVDLVYTRRNLRRIFVLTPERTKDIYKIKNQLDIRTFFFDEAQISEELQRGVVFDISVRRVKKHFPNARLIFAHPFVENPEAQLFKHEIPEDGSFSYSYSHGSVGRVCISKNRSRNKDYYFSPYIEHGYYLKNLLEFDGSFKDYAINSGKSILVYVSKSSIYKGNFKKEFTEYIDRLENIFDENGLAIIDEIQRIWGANSVNHKSSMIELLRKGVVIHHGSVPLEVRFLIEDFIRDGHASLCFSTSTLAQGINMPFDIVWLINNRFSGNEEERALAFKNLIGRAGRLSKEKKFDYGYVYTTKPREFSNKIKTSFRLSNRSVLDNPNINNPDTIEIIQAINNDTFDDDKNLPQSKIERLSNDTVMQHACEFLDIIYRDPENIKNSIGGRENFVVRKRAADCLKVIYEASLDRVLEGGESAVFNNSVMIFFLISQGYSFREIVGIRYSMITNRDNMDEIFLGFMQPANKLPDKNLTRSYSLYPENTPKRDVSYDVVAFDTYDYLDQVITFSLSDIFIAAFKIYWEKTNDDRAEKIIELLRYGTNNSQHILLMRYGFPPDIVMDISNYVASINDVEIVFKENITSAPQNVQDLVEWYMP